MYHDFNDELQMRECNRTERTSARELDAMREGGCRRGAEEWVRGKEIYAVACAACVSVFVSSVLSVVLIPCFFL